jgi:hypothetical protein
MILFTLIPDHVSGVGVLFPFQQYTTKSTQHSSIGLYNITLFNNKLPISS